MAGTTCGVGWGAGLCAAAMVAAGAPALGQPLPTYSVVYAELDGHGHHMDIYIPTGYSPPYPLVIWIHGGSWSSGNRWPIPEACRTLLQQGFAIASPSYRLTSQAGRWGSHGVSFPAQIHDLKGAVRYLRAHASEYGLDPERFGVFGGSAGGHLAALLATSGDEPQLEGDVGGNLEQSSSVLAAAEYYGPTKILRLMDDVTFPPGYIEDHDAEDSNASHFIGWHGPGRGLGDIKDNIDNPDPPYPQLLDLLEQANPIAWADPDDPPFVIAHGAMDRRIALRQSTRLAEALEAAGVPCHYIVVPGVDHSLSEVGAAANNAVVAHFHARLLRCRADFDRDGGLTPADFGAFRSAFLAGDLRADFDGDWMLGAGDFAAFRDRFLAGCP